MQHKSLLAALMVGVLALASCVKNEESQSVTDMRNARADEIKSQAELNRANAQAAITLAQAQATIAAAQAELLEAQAAIAAAQAAKIMVEAELQAVEVEIAKVKLEEEKVKLQAKKAELEALKAKYEAEIAKYEADKQEALNRLEKAQMQAEIDEVKAQIELINEQKNLFDAIAALEGAKQDEIKKIWGKYTAEVTKLNQAQTDLIEKQVQLAKLEAKETTSEEILAKAIQDKMAEIVAQQIYIAELESHLEMTAAELEAANKAATAALADAKSDELEANAELAAIVVKLGQMETATYAYQEGWGEAKSFKEWIDNLDVDANGIYGYEYYGDKVNVFQITDKLNEETGRWEHGFYFFYDSATPDSQIRQNTFYPLYTTTVPGSVPGNKFDFLAEDPYYYPGFIDGVAAPNNVWIEEGTYVPAKIYFENVLLLMNYVQSIEEGTSLISEYQTSASYDYADYSNMIQGWIDDIALTIQAYQEYVTEAEKEILPAYQAYKDAGVAYKAALLAENLAEEEYDYYLNSHDVSDAAVTEVNAAKNLKDATAALEKAQEDFDKASQVLYGTVPNEAVAEAGGDDEAAEEGLIDKVISLEDASYKAGLEAAAKYKAMKDAEEDVDPDLYEAWQVAIGALQDKKDEILGLKDAEDAALIEFHHWQIIYKADPSTENKGKMDEAEAALTAAKKAVTDAEAELPTLSKAVSDAKDDWDEVNDPYQKALKEYNAAKAVANKLKEEWEKAKAELGTRDNPEAGTAYYKYYAAQKALGNIDDEYVPGDFNSAYAEYNKAVKDLKDAQEANPDGAEELLQLREAWYQATLDRKAAKTTQNEEYTKYSALIYGAKAKYPKYSVYKNHITDGRGYYFDDSYGISYLFTDDYIDDWSPSYVFSSIPGQLLAEYYWYQEMLEAFEDSYEWFVEAVPGLLGEVATDYDALYNNLMGYYAEEDDYLENIAQMQAVYDMGIEAQKALIDAQNVSAKIEAARNALNTYEAFLAFSDGNNVLDINAYEAFIAEQKKALQKMEEEFAELMVKLEAGLIASYDAEGKITFDNNTIANLENEIEKLEASIEYHTAMIEYYLEALEAIMGADYE